MTFAVGHAAASLGNVKGAHTILAGLRQFLLARKRQVGEKFNVRFAVRMR